VVSHPTMVITPVGLLMDTLVGPDTCIRWVLTIVPSVSLAMAVNNADASGSVIL